MKILNIIKWVLFICAASLFCVFVAFFPDGVNDCPPAYIGLILGALLALLIAGILYCVTGSSTGVPRNYISDERLITKINIAEQGGKHIVEVVEVQKGVWEIIKVGYRHGQRLDMRDWIRQKMYIARLLKTSLVLYSYNFNKQKAFSLPYGTQKYTLQTLHIHFVDLNGKVKDVKIVDKFKIKKGFCLRMIFRFALTNNTFTFRELNLSHYRIQLSDIFNIKSLSR